MDGHSSADAEREVRRLRADLEQCAARLAAVLDQKERDHGYEQRLAAIVEGSRDAIWSWTAGGVITSWNAEAERLLSYAAEEIIGRSLLLLVPDERVSLAREAIIKLRGGGWYGQHETVRVHKNGRGVEVELTVSPIKNAAGDIVGAATVCRDITQRKEFERALSRRMAELSALYQLSDKLQHAATVIEVCESALDAIVSATGCERAAILMADASENMRFVAWRGLSDDYRRAVEGYAPAATNVPDPQPITVSDIDNLDIADNLKAIVRQEGIRALAFIPLLSSGRLIGRFMTYYSVPHDFSEHDVQLALTIARQIAFAIKQRHAQEAERTLTRELEHRTNNLLTVIQAIAHQSLAKTVDVDAARRTFEARLHALARAHRQITKSNWSGSSLRELASLELEPFGARARINGADVWLNPQDAQSFSLALHELATNAVKYGALSTQEGHIEVSWRSFDEGRQVSFRWHEQGGPPVASPRRHGFGTSLLRASFAKAHIDYRADGLLCELTVPAAHDRPLRN